jgi:hypothetical protein
MRICTLIPSSQKHHESQNCKPENHLGHSFPQRQSRQLRVVDPDAEEGNQGDEDDHAGDGVDVVEKDNEDPGAKAYRAIPLFPSRDVDPAPQVLVWMHL